jgi:endonuclease/exonuclease/phosphatase family metal-dependent hydrolase
MLKLIILLAISYNLLFAGIFSVVIKGGKALSKYEKVRKVAKIRMLYNKKYVKNRTKYFAENLKNAFEVLPKEAKSTKNRKKSKNKELDKNRKHIKNIKIASWNLQNLSINSNIEKQNRIKKYIQSLYIQGVDIVFLQEIKDSKQQEINYNKLFGRYNYFVSDYLGPTSHKERYVILIHDKLLLNLKITKYQIKELRSKNFNSFQRPPFGLILGKKLLLLNIHIVYSGNRKRELQQLKRKIYQTLRNHHITNNNFIVAGDFNLNISSIKQVFRKSNIAINQLTTNKNNYDHVITNLKLKRNTVSLLDRTAISDHSPIRVIIELNTKSTRSKKRI